MAMVLLVRAKREDNENKSLRKSLEYLKASFFVGYERYFSRGDEKVGTAIYNRAALSLEQPVHVSVILFLLLLLKDPYGE
jgi:hypothetical protein